MQTLKFKAITPFMDAVAQGMFSAGYFAKDAVCDIVPADMVRQVFSYILTPTLTYFIMLTNIIIFDKY